MMPGRVQSPYGIVECVGDPGKRMPIGCVKGYKGPPNKAGRKGTNIGVLGNVHIIIDFQEVISKRPEIYEKHCYRY
jgi:hypothetical protein